MDKDYANADSVREHHQRWVSAHRRDRFFGISIAMLAIGLAGLAWYIYPRLQRHDISLAQFGGFHQAVNTLNNQIREANEKLAAWSYNQDDLRQQLDKFGREMRSRLESATKQTSDTTAAMLQRVEAGVETQVGAVTARVDRLESSREEDQMRIANLQQQLGEVRGEMARQATELGDVRRRADENSSSGATVERQLASLQEQQQRDRQDVDAINSKLAVERVDFELSKGTSQQLAPGISLGLTGTDVQFHRVSGWLWMMPDRKTIWLRNQGAQVPLIFYGLSDGKKRELVVTGVTESSIAGYLILPKESQIPASAAGAGAGDSDRVAAQ